MIDDPRILAARLIAASPLAMSIAHARAHTQDRRRKLLGAPPAALSQNVEPDLTAPEPVVMPVVDAPEKYGADFWRNRAQPLGDPPPKPRPKPKTPRSGRKPVGDLPPAANRFTVIDGGEDGDKSKTD